MSRNRRNKYTPKDFETKSGQNKFVALYVSMLQSPAYMALTPSARSVYTVIKSQYNGNYNRLPGNRVQCPYAYIMKYTHCNKGTVSKALKELQDQGFIDISPDDRGGLNVATTYTFSSRWKSVTQEEARITRKTYDGRKKPPSDGNI